MTKLHDNIYSWLRQMVNKGHKVVAFVIMPNHMHLLLHISDNRQTINKIIANGKRFLAYEIVKRLKASGELEILQRLQQAVQPEERARNKKHRVFEISSDIKQCESEDFLLQKLEYIHANPVTGKWNLAEDFVKYSHSSACYYELNENHPEVSITHYLDIDL